MNFTEIFRIGVLTVALAGLVAAQTAQPPAGAAAGQPEQAETTGDQAERSVYAADPDDRPVNPGYPAEVPNRELSGNTPATNSTLQVAEENDGLQLRWLGLLGLGGLFGLARRPGRLEQPRGNEDRTEYHPQVSR